MMTRLKYLSVDTIDWLRSQADKNIERYKSGDFSDIIEAGGASIALSLEYDPEPLRYLKPDSSADPENAMLVWQALTGLTASLATEDRIWTRLTHLDCLEYSRARWLSGIADNELIKAVSRHMFAGSLTQYRDDNAVSRLWWGAYIAKQIWPHDHEAAVRLIMSKTDIRLNFVERRGINSRSELAASILRVMRADAWVTEREANFRHFMKTINKLGGGILFEVLDRAETDDFVKKCLDIARLSDNRAIQTASPGR